MTIGDAAGGPAPAGGERRWRPGSPGVVELPDGRLVRGRGLRRVPLASGDEPDLGAYLLRRPPTMPWEHEWIAWPDLRLPRDVPLALRTLARIHAAAATRRVEVACDGGIGRTGTALAILARMAGVPASDAVAWVRERYDPRALETPAQRRLAREVDLTAIGG
ncbi:hypothetical protein GCM10009846_27260 [Agrococcus versicolor]|uniref:Tyrosine specific protein phosphatases domain-containing protein n=1 Tax=Agrococcus versicolor TaxID=501482 RepID=A0ABP5MMG8_9MICO